MNKRERMECFLAREAYTDGIPAAFFQHFDASKRHGDAAMQAQLDFFHDTDMDMMKIMFDDIYPKFSVEKPEDWRRVPDFAADDPVFTQQIELAERLVKAVGKEAGVYQTIFSPVCVRRVCREPHSRMGQRGYAPLSGRPRGYDGRPDQNCQNAGLLSHRILRKQVSTDFTYPCRAANTAAIPPRFSTSGSSRWM